MQHKIFLLRLFA